MRFVPSRYLGEEIPTLSLPFSHTCSSDAVLAVLSPPVLRSGLIRARAGED
jgi:hypothetical protein